MATFISAALKGKELLKGTSTGGGGFLDSTTTPTTTTNQKFIYSFSSFTHCLCCVGWEYSYRYSSYLRPLYPAKAFVGDTFCYFAGMSFATVGILGHFSKTLLLFFIPQIMNLVYSIPQLFGFIPISRHRLPARDLLSNLLNPSMVMFIKPLSNLTTKTKILNVVEFLKLVKIDRNKEGLIIGCSNLTLLNFVLIWFPNKLNEEQLTIIILGFQFVSNFFGGFCICYYLSDLFYDSCLR
ncbi:hypothetical protein MJO28_001672 [Puccinia striiformis f. sp. tritici]|uniref:Uncharacterized protein n=1 Tax=Puccinia striiformis f. sp. tritici TaxID=168172 RepID=A0ACC0EU81_9BASI|nr:hypothetical protein MJO28_001672 [Puccinia striiformis f. sp. tritici]